MKLKHKRISTSFCKGLGKGADISEDQLAKVRKFTLNDIPADQLYARKMLLAHNAIDRDNERFSEKLLEDFVRTLPGKSLLIGHQWGPPGKGLFFDAYLEEMDLKAAMEATGEDLSLPEGVPGFKALMGWFYTTKTPEKEGLLADIDAGIVRHVSIGFNAANCLKVSNEANGETLYWEYRGPGEAREGSLVWLGAQPGATITKSADADGADIEDDKKAKEKPKMKTLLKKLGLGDDATEDQALNVLNQKFARLNGVEEMIAPLGENPSKSLVEEMKKDAEDGRAYRKDLVGRQVKCERLLGRIDDKPEAVATRETELGKRSAAEIKGDVAYLERLVEEKFPGQSKLEGSDPNANRSGKAADGEAEHDFRKKD